MAECILLVDDSPEILRTTRVLLESQGYEITTARDGILALQQVSEQRPDLIILDVMMPRLGGWATLKALQSEEQTAHIPVLMLTGLADPADVKEGFDLGCTWFYSKPLTNYEDFLLLIRRILDVTQADEAK